MTTAPLQGIKVIDWTQVQSGPSCTQLLAWLGADVIKIERPGTGDPTRTELLDIPDSDGLYFLQLNCNKRSIELDAKSPEGKEILTKLLKTADIFVENLHPGAADKLGFSWEEVHKLNPKLIYGTIKGFNPQSPYSNVKAFEPVAQCTGGAAATTGWWSGEYNIPTQSGAALGDSNTGMHLTIGLLAALMQREKTGEGCYVYQSMQEAVLNLCRIKLRDQLILEHTGTLKNFPGYPKEKVGTTVPRYGNAEGGQVLGWCYKCKGWENDSNAYVYIVLQNEDKAFAEACKGIGKTEWINDSKYNTPKARDLVKDEIYKEIENFTMTMDKFQVVEHLSKFGVPCGPVLTMAEIEKDESLKKCGTLVEVDQPGRGKFLTIGCPPKFSNFTPEIKKAPALGEHTNEILKEIGYTDEEINQLHNKHVVCK
ncbi:MAG: formyl-CoA transferase [Cetobacterium sp.]|uniref:formyl-CoA transferase n=1 Tax=Cetobacterium sp. TaxID=2071632 RepID=UPI003F406732